MSIRTINVTKEDIENGGFSCTDCPVATAINRHMISDYLAFVVSTCEIVKRDGQEIRHPGLKLPADAAWFVRKYDLGDDVEPFSFDLDIPDEFLAKEGGDL